MSVHTQAIFELWHITTKRDHPMDFNIIHFTGLYLRSVPLVQLKKCWTTGPLLRNRKLSSANAKAILDSSLINTLHSYCREALYWECN